jgi:hypothetical protein
LSLVTLPGVDADVLSNYQLEDGATFADVAADVQFALEGVNNEIQNDPLWASMVSYTDQPDLEYRQGTSNGFTPFVENSRPDAQRAETTGHLLPLRPWNRALGWTWNYLRKARMAQVQADIADAIEDVRTLFRVQFLTRALRRTDETGAVNGLGSGYSPGFATTAASTAVDFTPPTYGGTAFADTHEHYVGIAGGAFTDDVFFDARNELREHGHTAPFAFLIGTADRLAVEALSKFTKGAIQGVRSGITQDVATPNTQIVGSDWATYLGIIEDFEVYEVRGMPQYYGFGYKSYGPNSQRNPLRARLGKGLASPTVIAMPDPVNGNATHPLQYLMLFAEFGVGVYDRTAGTARYVNNATWANGTPT